MKTIAILSTVHPFDDTRVFYRQARSLSKKYNVNLYISAPFNFRKFNDNLMVWGLPEWKKKTDRIKSFFILFKYLVKLKANLIIIHDPELLLIVPIIKILKRVPIIYDIHENYVEMIREKLWLSIGMRKLLARGYLLSEKITFPFISMIWYPVKNIGDHYTSRNCLVKYQIRNVPSVQSFQSFNRANEEKKWLISLGYLIDDRGIREIILAFSLVLKDYPDYQLVFIGSFQSERFEQEIFALVSKLQIKDRVIFFGKIPYEKVANYLYNAQIGLLNYLPIPNNIMGLPNKLFEYMAAGLPVIASNFENYAEVINDAQCGILVNPTDPDEIAAAIIFLLNDEKKRIEMGKNGQLAIEDRYCWEMEEKKMFTSLERILN